MSVNPRHPAVPGRRRRAAEDAQPRRRPPPGDRRRRDGRPGARGGSTAPRSRTIAAEAGVAPGLVHLLTFRLEGGPARPPSSTGSAGTSAAAGDRPIEGLHDPIDKVEHGAGRIGRLGPCPPRVSNRIVFDLHAVGVTPTRPCVGGSTSCGTGRSGTSAKEVEAIYRETGIGSMLPPRRVAELIAASVDGSRRSTGWPHGTDLEEGHRTLKLVPRPRPSPWPAWRAVRGIAVERLLGARGRRAAWTADVAR